MKKIASILIIFLLLSVNTVIFCIDNEVSKLFFFYTNQTDTGKIIYYNIHTGEFMHFLDLNNRDWLYYDAINNTTILKSDDGKFYISDLSMKDKKIIKKKELADIRLYQSSSNVFFKTESPGRQYLANRIFNEKHNFLLQIWDESGKLMKNRIFNDNFTILWLTDENIILNYSYNTSKYKNNVHSEIYSWKTDVLSRVDGTVTGVAAGGYKYIIKESKKNSLIIKDYQSGDILYNYIITEKYQSYDSCYLVDNFLILIFNTSMGTFSLSNSKFRIIDISIDKTISSIMAKSNLDLYFFIGGF